MDSSSPGISVEALSTAIAEAVEKGVSKALQKTPTCAKRPRPQTPSTKSPERPASTGQDHDLPRRAISLAKKGQQTGPSAAPGVAARSSVDVKPSVKPIRELTPTTRGFVIKGRIISKSRVAPYDRGAGEGKVSSIEVIDDGASVVRITFYDRAVETLFSNVEPGKVFLFYGGRATKPSPKYNAGAVVEIKYYGLGLGAALVEEVDDDPGIPHMPPHHFRTISEVKAMPYGSIVDVRGIILSCTNVTTVHIKKTDEKKAKRNYTIIDETDVIEVAVWDDKARESVITPVVAETRPVATLKSARLVEFNDGSLVAGDHTIVQVSCMIFSASPTNFRREYVGQVNPDILEVDTIRDWWERQSAGLGVHECQNDNGLQADVIDLMSN